MAAEVMTTRQAAEFLQLSEQTVKDKARAGEIPAAKIGRAWRFRKADLDAWLSRGGTRYEDLVERGLLQATMEAIADPDKRWYTLEEAKRALGL